MRFFLLRDGTDVVQKCAYSGDDKLADSLVLKEAGLLSVEEVDEVSFNATPTAKKTSKEQTDWQTEKAKGAAPALTYIAKKLGLE